MPKIVAIATARNEADIIEAFVRHTAVYCDEILLIDHGSSDQTPEILKSLIAEGIRLRVMTDATIGSIQTAHMNRLLKMAADELAADWILALDSDEFIHGEVIEALRRAPDDPEFGSFYYRIPWRNYFAHACDDPALLNPVERLTHWDRSEPGGIASFKSVIPGVLARQESAFLEQGNHWFLVGGFKPPFRLLPNVWLGHFSLRTPVQYGTKLVARVVQRLRRIADRTALDTFYDEPYRLLRENYSGFIQEFPVARLSYHSAISTQEELIKEPFPYRGGNLRYTPPLPGMDELINQILVLSEGLIPEGGLTRPKSVGLPHAHEICISLRSKRLPGRCIEKNVRIAQASYLSVSFPVEEFEKDAPLVLEINRGPCVVEFTSLSFLDQTGKPVGEEIGARRLRSMVKCMEMSAILTADGLIRVLVSDRTARLEIKDWFATMAGKAPTQLVFKVRISNRDDLVGAVLCSPSGISKLSRLAKQSVIAAAHKAELEAVLEKSRQELEHAKRSPLKFLLGKWRASCRVPRGMNQG